jgi:arylsulfatase
MAPFYQMKRSAAEGGIRAPAFVWYPGFKRQSAVSDALITVRDIAPTLLRLAGVDYSGDHFEGRRVEPISGRPLVGFLNGAAAGVHDEDEALAWELFGHRAVRRGPWKLLSLRPPYGDGAWRLYHLETDPAERHDLATAEPEKVRLLKSDWDAYAKANQVVMPATD